MFFPTPQTVLLLLRLLLLACLPVLAGCNSIPYARDGELPPRIEVADGSAQRTALNAKTYDAAVRHTGRLFYRDTSNFTHIAREQRDSVVAQPDEDSFYIALNEVLSTLDDAHSHAVGPDERATNEKFRLTGDKDSRIGYGFIAAGSGKGESVLTVLTDSKASEAGIVPGWKIMSVDGQPPGMHQKQEGRLAHFLFEDREGHQHEHDLTAYLSPPVQFRESRYLPGNFLYLHWMRFDDETLQWLRASFAAAHEEDRPEGVVIDLRGNIGGLAWVASEVYAMLDGDGVFAWSRDGRGQKAIGPASPSLRYGGSPLLVLVDAASHSAAELLAARLQETGRAILIGETTTGAVVLSRDINLPDGGKLSIGTQEILTGDGQVLEGKGVSPYFAAPWTPAAIREGRDPALEVVAMFAEELVKSGAGRRETENANKKQATDDKDN